MSFLLFLPGEEALYNFTNDGYELSELLVAIGRPAISSELIVLFGFDMKQLSICEPYLKHSVLQAIPQYFSTVMRLIELYIEGDPF